MAESHFCRPPSQPVTFSCILRMVVVVVIFFFLFFFSLAIKFLLILPVPTGNPNCAHLGTRLILCALPCLCPDQVQPPAW